MKNNPRIIAALKIWLVIYPSITSFLLLFGKMLGPLPLYLRTFVLTIILVPWMIFGGLPLLNLINRQIFKHNKKVLH